MTRNCLFATAVWSYVASMGFAQLGTIAQPIPDERFARTSNIAATGAGVPETSYDLKLVKGKKPIATRSVKANERATWSTTFRVPAEGWDARNYTIELWLAGEKIAWIWIAVVEDGEPPPVVVRIKPSLMPRIIVCGPGAVLALAYWDMTVMMLQASATRAQDSRAQF